jgi:serine/threonine protein kinase
MIGQNISHYKVITKLGEGGMGAVYLAEDTKLERKVALKFLPTQATADDEAVDRFRREAKAAAALNHPNIITVHEIDEFEGQIFIAMEYVDGTSLRERISDGPLSVEAVVNLASQICEGLGKAHRAGIVHRDIKPENILIDSDGRVKILDFGLAKLKGAGKLTKEQSTLGTVYYMSPEQAKGDELDLRTDIWSFGVALYEMLTGKRPFRGEYDQAVIYSILNEQPKPVTGLRTGLPMELERIVNKTLAKNLGERYQHLDDLIVDLNSLKPISADMKSMTSTHPPSPGTKGRISSKTVPLRTLFYAVLGMVFLALVYLLYPKLFPPDTDVATSKVKKIAVLFFQNLGPEGDEYFADGITDAITARLANIHGLGVISRQSTIQYKGTDKGIRQIGEELGVDYILEGTIQRERPSDPQSRVRIIPQLIRVSDDMHIWADTYDDEMKEVFRLQSQIAERVAQALDIALLEPERELLTTKPTENIEAYEYYLRGNDYLTTRFNLENSGKAIQMYQQAVELDPSFTLAWAGLVRSYSWRNYIALQTFESNDIWLEKARSALNRMAALDTDHLEAHLARGYYYYYGERDYHQADEELEAARKRQPGNPEILLPLALVKRRLGRWNESISLDLQAQELSPRNSSLYYDTGVSLQLLRRYAEAEQQYLRYFVLAPEQYAIAGTQMPLLYLCWDGNTERARASLLEAAIHVNSETKLIENLFLSVVRCLPDVCQEILDAAPPEKMGPPDSRELYLLALGEIYTGLNEQQQAITCYDSLRVLLETKISQENMRLNEVIAMTHGYACARLGRKDEALRQAALALELMPVSKDALEGGFIAAKVAEMYVMCERYDASIDLLDELLSIPSPISVNLLRIDPIWDQIRDHPRFQKLLETYGEAK